MSLCCLCPRSCGVDRTAATGFCGATAEMEVSAVCVHRGEEPPLNPIVNVFFPHCNLQCVYCQNWQISVGTRRAASEEDRSVVSGRGTPLSYIVDRICALLPESGGMLGLVTAAHYADRIPELLETIRQRGFSPTVVYNSGGYERVETLRSLEGLVDVYLPDFKYMDPALALAYSHAEDYPEVAQVATKEMIRQVGNGLKIDDDGRAYRGIIVRHLVLPGHVDNSLAVLDQLSALGSPVSPLYLSLMAQYFPPRPGLPAPLDRSVTAEEYATVVAHAEALGLTNGWIQELEARDNYRPDFDNTCTPFK